MRPYNPNYLTTSFSDETFPFLEKYVVSAYIGLTAEEAINSTSS
jgi:hypothetical protein